MRRINEGEGSSEAEGCITVIETAAETLDGALIFHLVKEVAGYVLFMNQQIPRVLQDLTCEFDEMHTERKHLELLLTQTEVKAALRRKHNGRMREVKQGIRKLEKFMNSVSSLHTAIQLMLNEINTIQGVLLILGSSPVRPQHVYEMLFSYGRAVSENAKDYTTSKAADALSRKAIRALLSKDPGSISYAGPTKLFLLVKAPATLNLPLQFLPKRDFRYSKKIVPLRLHIKCKVRGPCVSASHHHSPPRNSISSPGVSSNEMIWFQCKHVIKGLTLRTPLIEE